MNGPPRISLTSRRMLRELLSDSSYLRQIHNLFSPEGFRADPEHDTEVSGERRTLVEQYYHSIDWQSADHTRRVLGIIEHVLRDTAPSDGPGRRGLIKALENDGFNFTDGHLVPSSGTLGVEALADLRDDSAILLHLERLDGTDVESRPEEAIGTAKDLIESALKTVLDRLGGDYEKDETVPALVKKVHTALAIHRSSIAPTAPGAEVVMKILGNLSQLAVGIAELRNIPGYAVGHGQSKRIGVRSRHARLVVRSTIAYVGFLFETMNDPAAPWQKPGRSLVSYQSAAAGSTSGANSSG